MKLFFRQLFFLIFINCLFIASVYATHIRAGEILARNVNGNPLEYEFTLYLYTDLNSVVESFVVTFNFDDGTNPVDVPRTTYNPNIGNGTAVNTYVIRHTFNSATGTRYVVTSTILNRNPGVLNFENSGNSPFHIETDVVLNASAGINETPRFTQVPVVNAVRGQRWIFDNGGYDPDGDSISYEWTVPKVSTGVDVFNYRDPEDVSGGLTEDGSAPAFLDLDFETGILIWDAPNLLGLYNIAFKIVEWKENPFTGEKFKNSTVTRDMQIIVQDFPNLRPNIEAKDTCIVAGRRLLLRANASDPDIPSDNLFLSASGEPFELALSPATYSPDTSTAVPSPATLIMDWSTVCSHIRASPYRAVFRVDDDKILEWRLTDFAESNIKVIGPAPILNSAVVQTNDAIELQWSTYSCTQASSMAIYRRIGDFGDSASACQTGPLAGFSKIDNVSINDFSYIDDGGPQGLRKGPSYCYLLVAEFDDGAESLPSNQECAALPINVPLITNVDVNTTSETGEIFIKWTRPLELDSIQNPPPYSYVVKGDGNTLTTLNDLNDTTYVWTNVNTESDSHFVEIEFYSQNIIEEPIPKAGSVFLESTPGGKEISLSWSAEVPWTNSNFYHKIYRRDNEASAFNLIDSVLLLDDDFNYTDRGAYLNSPLINGREYCYYVETQGSYFNEVYNFKLTNRSQIKCDIPQDSIAPCPPELRIASQDCDLIYADKECGDSLSFQDIANFNVLNWEPDLNDPCDTEIALFRIYYKADINSEFRLIDSVSADFRVYEDRARNTLTGCYVITAVDSFNNESDFSNEVCNENCFYFDLPNVFTPNDDVWNNTFVPCKSVNGVLDIDFEVYNRWGQRIRVIENNTRINWDGLDSDGNELPSGYYFYKAEVEFLRLDPEEANQSFNGWIWLAR